MSGASSASRRNSTDVCLRDLLRLGDLGHRAVDAAVQQLLPPPRPGQRLDQHASGCGLVGGVSSLPSGARMRLRPRRRPSDQLCPLQSVAASRAAVFRAKSSSSADGVDLVAPGPGNRGAGGQQENESREATRRAELFRGTLMPSARLCTATSLLPSDPLPVSPGPDRVVRKIAANEDRTACMRETSDTIRISRAPVLTLWNARWGRSGGRSSTQVTADHVPGPRQVRHPGHC